MRRVLAALTFIGALSALLIAWTHGGSGGGGGGGSPQLFQAYVWTGSSTGQAVEKSKTWTFTLPEVSGSNNTYILTMAYPTGTAPTITDTNSNSWPASPSKVVSGGANDLATWVVQGITTSASQNTITATFGSVQQPVSGEMQEWSGLATSGGLTASSSSANVAAPNLTAGSLTPSSASMIFAFFYDAFGNDPGPTHFTPSASFSMMQGNSIEHGNFAQGQPMASSYFNQTSPALISPGMTSVGEVTTTYNGVSIALAVSSGAGTPPPAHLRIAKITKMYVPDISGATSATTNSPALGNFRVFHTSTDDATVTGISDSDGSYTNLSPGGAMHPGFYYLKNTSQDSANVLTVTWANTAVGNTDIVIYDIANADTSTVIGATAFADGVQPNPNPTTGAPNITPTSTSSLVLWCFSNGLGPSETILSPSGAHTVNMTLAAGTEADNGINSGDEWGYLHNTSLSAQNWTVNVANPGNTFNANAIEILP